MRPKPLMPTFTAICRFPPGGLGLQSARRRASVGADRDLDLVPVRVLEECRVRARARGAALAGLADADPAGFDAVLPGGLDRDDPEAGEAEQPEARRGRVVLGDEED